MNNVTMLALTKKRTAMEWEPFFMKAGVRVEELSASKSKQSKAVKIGQLLAANVGRELRIQVDEEVGTAILRVVKKRSKEKRYYFEVRWDSNAASQKTKSANRKADEVTTKAVKETANGVTSKKKRHTAVVVAEAPKKKTLKNKASKASGKGNHEDW